MTMLDLIAAKAHALIAGLHSVDGRDDLRDVEVSKIVEHMFGTAVRREVYG